MAHIYLDEHDLAHISINLCDFETTSLHVVYEAVCHDADIPRSRSSNSGHSCAC